MLPIDRILNITSDTEFEEAALELFRFQSVSCEPYRRYMEYAGIDLGGVASVENIPFLPIELFKSCDVYCNAHPPEVTFTSSTTGGGKPSRHMMAHTSDYEKTFRKAFGIFYGCATDRRIYALLPGYLEREGSSLIYMADRLIADAGGGFYLDDYGRLLEDMYNYPGEKILLGVSYALLDLAELRPGSLKNTVIMETGGMKGKREEMTKPEFHAILKSTFGVDSIHSEYGMAELSSQAYSRGEGVFQTPPWMRVFVRDLNDPFADHMPDNTAGGINIIDLANISSCAFIQTQDIGIRYPDGSFSISGRADRSEIRGCNLLVQ